MSDERLDELTRLGQELQPECYGSGDVERVAGLLDLVLDDWCAKSPESEPYEPAKILAPRVLAAIRAAAVDASNTRCNTEDEEAAMTAKSLDVALAALTGRIP